MRVLIALLCAPAAFAGCVAFGEAKPSSNCTKSSPDLEWTNATFDPAAGLSSRYEPAIADPGFGGGVYAAGTARFRFRAGGPHLLEIFLWAPDDGKHSFRLAQGGGFIDPPVTFQSGPVRLRPKTSIRPISLIGMARGEQDFEVRTECPRYVLAAVRWTPRGEFEKTLAPRWLERGRYWLSGPIFSQGTGGVTRRAGYLEQLFHRLVFSTNAEIKREALLGLTRASYWVAAENHEPRDIARTDLLFREALRIMPDDTILRQMVSASCVALNAPAGRMPHGPYCEEVKPVPWSVPAPPAPPGAPAWAVEQRKLALRMDAITRWWVDKRQQPNGELGGGWGDDVEILRHWGPQALGLGSGTAERGIRNLAEGLWRSGTLAHGYDRGISDVEHSSEPTTDTQPLAAAIAPADPAVRARLKETADCAHNWILRQPDGRWRFRGAWFNCREYDPSPARALDVHLNTRAMGPALWYAYLSRDPGMIELLGNWASAWVEAMRSTAHGKPAGVFPPVVRAADGSYLIGSEAWDKPDAEWDYFQWSGGSQEALASLLLAIHDLTGDLRWLDAAGESFQVLEKCGPAKDVCAQIVNAPEAFYEWRRRTGEARYDRAFRYAPDRDAAAILELMARQARETEAGLGVNFDMFTSEVMYTDRVYYRLPPEYRQHLFGGETPRGDRYPTFAVTWPAVAGQFARAVLEAAPDRLSIRAYNFESEELAAPLRVWRLAPGRYDLIQPGQATRRITISARPQVIELRLPPRQEVRITISLAARSAG